ncbi:MAG: hypothetical protein HYY06_02055 [Deltaproteobacteria bacterium]|nr:hypothetical protein [Deltaproteobacteria bacterium]
MRVPSSAVAAVLAAIAACASSPEGDPDDLEVVPPGKADNYYSNVAAELEVSGTIPVTLTAEEYADEVIRGDRVSRRLTAVGLYLTTFLTDKFRGIDINGDGEITEDEVFFRNESYGGFHAMVRNYSVEALEVIGDATQGYSVRFTIDVAGPRDFLSKLVGVEGQTFDLQMPLGATIDPANVPRGEIRKFDPSTYQGEIETVRCEVRPLPVPANAYPHYADFVADGVYDITLLYGHDYNKARSDLRESREAWDTLEELGFNMPAPSFEDLGATSGPAVLEARAGGRDVRMEVRIFNSEMFVGDRQKQHDLALEELTTRDVFFYNGHAGPYFGFYLDAERVATVNYWELAEAPFTGKQQLAIAQGCQTYSQYADMLYASPEKSEDDLDVITTVNFSYGRGTMGIVRNLIRVDAQRNHQPVDFYRIVSDLNYEWLNSYRSVFYGVMGVDGNPQLHPYASAASIGQECAAPSDCGDPSGNVCLAEESGPKRCGAVALAETACPAGSRYRLTAAGGTIQGGACLPGE